MIVSGAYQRLSFCCFSLEQSQALRSIRVAKPESSGDGQSDSHTFASGYRINGTIPLCNAVLEYQDKVACPFPEHVFWNFVRTNGAWAILRPSITYRKLLRFFRRGKRTGISGRTGHYRLSI